MKGMPDYFGALVGCVTKTVLRSDLWENFKKLSMFGEISKKSRFKRNSPVDATRPYGPRIISENQFSEMDFRLIFEPYLRPPLSQTIVAFNWP